MSIKVVVSLKEKKEQIIYFPSLRIDTLGNIWYFVNEKSAVLIQPKSPTNLREDIVYNLDVKETVNTFVVTSIFYTKPFKGHITLSNEE